MTCSEVLDLWLVIVSLPGTERRWTCHCGRSWEVSEANPEANQRPNCLNQMADAYSSFYSSFYSSAIILFLRVRRWLVRSECKQSWRYHSFFFRRSNAFVGAELTFAAGQVSSSHKGTEECNFLYFTYTVYFNMAIQNT